MEIPLGVGSYESNSVPFAAQRCVNMYCAPAQAAAESQFALFITPGIVQLGTKGGVKKSRGAHVMNGVYYIVIDTTLYSMDSVGAFTTIGTIAGAVRCDFCDNGEKMLIIVPGGNGYEYNATTTTLSQVVDVDFPTPTSCAFKDGYYFVTEEDTDDFYFSALNDPTSWSALDTEDAELAPDNAIAVHAAFDEIYIIGSTSTEVYRNVGGTSPWQRIPGASFEKGTHGKYTPIQWEDSFFFVGGGPNQKSGVYQAQAGGAQKISTDAIDNEIQKFTATEIAEAFSFTYSISGYNFVGFTFESVPTDNKTFVFNITASQTLGRPVWHEQQTGITDNSWRVYSINNCYDMFLVSDNTDGRVGYLDVDTYQEYSATVVSYKTTAPFFGDGSSLLIPKMELIADIGQGLIDGTDPKISMEYSDDGARTWSNEKWRSLGKIGEYLKRAVWRNLGRVPHTRVFRFTQTAAVKRAWYKINATVTGGHT